MYEEKIREAIQSPNSCVTCVSLDAIEAIASETAFEFFITSSQVVFTVVSAVLTLYVTWKLAMALLGRSFDPSELFAVVLRLSLVIGVTMQPEPLFEAMYTAYAVGLNLATKVFGSSMGATTLAGLLFEVEASVRSGLGMKVAAMFRDMSIFRLGAMFAMTVLVVPLAVLAWEMVRYFFRPLFVTFGIGMLMPVICACFVFERSTPIAVNALKLLAAASLQMVLAAAVVSFMLEMIGAISSVAAQESAIELFSAMYFIVLLTSSLMIFLFPVVMQLPEALMGIVGGQTQTAAATGMLNGARWLAKRS